MTHPAPYTVLIPARMAASRLPEKPLADIAGLPMVVRVAKQAARSAATRVVVAADDERILRACAEHSIEAHLTRADHPCGSDRLAEMCALLHLPNDGLVVNVQGDEPLIPPALIDAVAALLQNHPQWDMGTAAHPISDLADYSNPNVVKVVCNAMQEALYFSRAPIPFARNSHTTLTPSAAKLDSAQQLQAHDMGYFSALPQPTPARHIGIYSYRVGFLRRFPSLAAAPIENTEALEQLRALWHGYRIGVYASPYPPSPGVDTPQDLERVRALFKNQI